MFVLVSPRHRHPHRRHRRRCRRPLPRLPPQDPEVLRGPPRRLELRGRRQRDRRRHVQRDGHGEEPQQEDRHLLPGRERPERVVHRRAALHRELPSVLPGPPKHDCAARVARRRSKDRERVADGAAAAAADRDDTVGRPGSRAGESEAWEAEAVEGEVQSEVQSGGEQPQRQRRCQHPIQQLQVQAEALILISCSVGAPRIPRRFGLLILSLSCFSSVLIM